MGLGSRVGGGGWGVEVEVEVKVEVEVEVQAVGTDGQPAVPTVQ